MTKLLAIAIALNVVLTQSVAAAAEQEISVRCANSLAVVKSHLVYEKNGQHDDVFSKYKRIWCEDRGDYIALELKLFSADVDTVRDGEDYFLVDAQKWAVVEKWVGGRGGWIDPSYERKGP